MERADGHSWLVDGQCPMYDFLTYFDREDFYQPDSGYTTLAGLVLETLKHVPTAGETLQWRDFNLEIVDMDGARIDKIMVTRIDKK